MAGGSSINSDGAEKQKAFGVIVSNDLYQPLSIRQAPDHHDTYFVDDLGAFASIYLRNIFGLTGRSEIAWKDG